MFDAVAAELAEIVAPLPRFPKTFSPPVRRRSTRRLPARRRGAWLAVAVAASAVSLVWLLPHADAGSASRANMAKPATQSAVERSYASAQPSNPVDAPETRPPRPDVEAGLAEPIGRGLASSGASSRAVAERTSRWPRRGTPTRVAYQAGDAAGDRPATLADDEACSDRSYLAWCRRGDEQQADRSLRQAYERAVRRGVDTPLLTHVREDWADLRHQAIDDPDEMIEGYRHLDDVLRRATDRMDAQ